MPIYEYQCDVCGVSFEVLQRMSDDPLETCEQCGGSLHKVLHPVAIHFKGSGFYTTDYGRGSGRAAGARDGGSDGDSSSSSSDGGATAAKPDKTDKSEAKSTGKESKAAT